MKQLWGGRFTYMPAKHKINSVDAACQLDVIRLAHVRECNDDICAFVPELARQSFADLFERDVRCVGRQSWQCFEPFPVEKIQAIVRM